MNWRETLRSRVDAYLQQQDKLRMIISADIDGCVSAAILAEYAKKHFSISAEIVGIYDFKRIVVTNSSITQDDAFKSLWADLDVHFPKENHNIVHVGQHLLRKKINSVSFNPNDFFGINKIPEKYPFSTAFFLFYGLFDESEFPIFTDRQSLAQSCLFHSDVLFMLVRKFRRNCIMWVNKLFGDDIPQSVQYLMSREYEKNNLETHCIVYNKFQNALGKRIIQTDVSRLGWNYVNQKTTVEGSTDSKTFENIRAINNCIKHFFNMESNIDCDTDAQVIWQGKRHFLPAGKENLDEAVSHAWVRVAEVSVTYETN